MKYDTSTNLFCTDRHAYFINKSTEIVRVSAKQTFYYDYFGCVKGVFIKM